MTTLVLNMVEVTGETPIPNEDDDCPSWERDDAFLPDRSKPLGYLDYLTWQNRKIWLSAVESDGRVLVDRMCWAPGLRLEASDTDPHKQYVKNDEEGWNILCFRGDKALWRDSATLLQLSENSRQPIVVQWLGTLASQGKIDQSHRFRLIALGMAKDRASLEFLRAESMPLPLPYLQDQTRVSQLGSALKLAEDVATQLYFGQRDLARWYLKPEADEQDLSKDDREGIKELATSWHADRRYWSQLEVRFNVLIEGLPVNPEATMQEWRGHLRRTANDAFDYAEACVGADMRAYRARALARETFEKGLNFTLSVRNKATAKPDKQGDV